MNVLWSPFPRKQSTKNPEHFSGKFGAKFEAKFGVKIRKFGDFFWPKPLWHVDVNQSMPMSACNNFISKGHFERRAKKKDNPKVSALLRERPILLRANLILSKGPNRPYYAYSQYYKGREKRHININFLLQ